MRESLLSKLFNNKIFLIVFSVLLASFIWLFITAEKTGNINRTVTNVEINLETKEKGSYCLLPYPDELLIFFLLRDQDDS